MQEVCRQFEQYRGDEVLLAEKAFYFVQNTFPHTSDCKRTELAVSASDVIKIGHGICMAKSHLYAAILRNFGIPTGFCYQILGLTRFILSLLENGFALTLAETNLVRMQNFLRTGSFWPTSRTILRTKLIFRCILLLPIKVLLTACENARTSRNFLNTSMI